MHRALSLYIQRFQPVERKKLGISSFFTSFSKDYAAELPYLYDIEQVCQRLQKALVQEEKICIYSDYDTDAVTATATMYWGLVLLGFKKDKLEFYAPDRFSEGYGMNTEAVTKLADQYDLIISVDCGINSVEEAKICQSKGVDLIITDHHSLNGDIPPAFATINPRLSEFYSNKPTEFAGERLYLSSSVTGVGVAWFVVVWLGYYLKHQSSSLPKDFDLSILNQLLGFVAIGTIADCQSILDETNRMLVKSGLKMIQHLSLQEKPNEVSTGLWLLLDLSGLRGQVANGYQIVSSDLGFTLSPILNSSGRLSHASHSIATLLSGNTGDRFEQIRLVEDLIATNNQRKLEVSQILMEVETEAERQSSQGEKVIWVANQGWGKGLIGLLASRLVNKFDLPVVVVELPEVLDSPEEVSGATATASLRAPEGYNLPASMQSDPGLFLKFGGHPGAAGFTAKLEKLKEIKSCLQLTLNQQALNLKDQKIIYQKPYFDLMRSEIESKPQLAKLQFKKQVLWLESLDLFESGFWTDLLSLEPFGQDFPNPVLVFPIQVGKVETLSQGVHLKILPKSNASFVFSLICFNYRQKKIAIEDLGVDKKIWVIGRAQQNAWKGRVSWQVVAEDLIC